MVAARILKKASELALKRKKKRDILEKEPIVTAKKKKVAIQELKKQPTPKGLTSSPGRSTAAAQDALGKRSVTGQSEKGYRGEIKNISVESKIPKASKTSKKKRLLNANIAKLKSQKKYLESLKNKKNLDEADKLKSNAIKRDFGNLSQINNRIKELEKKTYPSQSQIKKQLEYYKYGGKVKKLQSGGRVGAPRGTGAALRGFGKGYK
tara:strand:- start:17 stop:640 length:624 start_codon:yes stop_codon:yes gene_type:complete